MEIRSTSCRVDSYRAAFSSASRSQSSTERCALTSGSVIGSPSGDDEIGQSYCPRDGAPCRFAPKMTGSAQPFTLTGDLGPGPAVDVS
ncbi:hypothetical protein GCM10010428_22780 [Actinosynnema pretiosum subsp. pretiosum]